MPDDKTSIFGNKTYPRAINFTTSFVATVASKKKGLVAEFRIGRGEWIIQAKMSVRAQSLARFDVQLRVTATADATVDDAAKATVHDIGYATLVALVGVSVSSSALIVLDVEDSIQSQSQGYELFDIVVSGILQERLTIVELGAW